MQNKPNLLNAEMNVNKVLTKDYDKMDTWWSGKNKPNSNPIQTQNKPNFKGKRMLDNVECPNPEYDKPFNKHASQLFQKWLSCADTNEAL